MFLCCFLSFLRTNALTEDTSIPREKKGEREMNDTKGLGKRSRYNTKANAMVYHWVSAIDEGTDDDMERHNNHL